VRFDVKGSLTLALGATLILAGINQGPKWGWSAPATITCFVIGVLSLVAFVRIEQRVRDPLLVLAWFKTRNIAFPVLSQTLLNFAYMGGFLLAPRVLQEGLEFTESKTGFLIIARPLVFSLMAPLAGYVTIRVGERVAGVTGGLGVVASMLCWAFVGASSPMWFIALALGLSGAGLGAAFPALTALTINAVDESSLGVAGAMQQLMNQLGAVVGSVVLATVSVGAGPGDLGPFRLAFVVAAVVGVGGCVAAGFVRSTARS
jgi:MFS family permease